MTLHRESVLRGGRVCYVMRGGGGHEPCGRAVGRQM